MKRIWLKFTPFVLLLFSVVGRWEAKSAAVPLPYGVKEGDQVLALQPGTAAAATTLSQPFTFFERKHSELFISEHGAISLSAAISEPRSELDAEKKDVIAVFYAPTTAGSVFYRSSHGGSPLSREISAKVRRAFTVASAFESQSSVLITWENVRSASRQQQQNGSNTYQLALASDSRSSYVVFIYHKIEWASAKEESPSSGSKQFAQAGFFSADGRIEKLVNSGTPAVSDLSRITNFNEAGIFLYRVSGSHPVDPRHSGVSSLNGEDEEYVYPDGQEDYDPDEQIVDCPSDPFRDRCPPQCNVVTDDKDCSLCICSSVVSENVANPSYAKVSPNDIEPVVDDQSAVNLDSSPNDDAIRNGNEQTAVNDQRRNQNEPASERIPSKRTSDMSCSPQTRGQCHAKADCIHFGQAGSGGYCCECEPNHFGNGVECLSRDGPQRVDGIFEAVINGKQIDKTDFFAYIQVQDAQQHTALARIPKETGWSLALLDSIGNGMGWLFAKSSSGSNLVNGFQLTGGAFNRTLNIHLGDRYAIVVKQTFKDRQFKDAFSVDTFVSGTLPEFSMEKKVMITFPNFDETYHRERSGVIRAYNERHITVNEEGMEEKRYRVTTDQQIHYFECAAKVDPNQDEQVVRFERISVLYDPEQNIVRFASQALSGARPAVPPQQHPVYSNGNAIQHSGEGLADTDPCSPGSHYCTQPNMVCRPRQPSYSCECQSGFHFERDANVEAGFRCVSVVGSPSSAGHQSGSRTGNSCTHHQECHKWGECTFETASGGGNGEQQQSGKPAGICKCRDWYVGDGVKHCGPPGETIHPLPVDSTLQCGDYVCDRNADCMGESERNKNCVCRIGFRGNGINCQQLVNREQERERDAYEHSPSVNIGAICRGQTDCGVNAHCVYSVEVNYYRCECLPNYSGNGVECAREISVSSSAESSCESKLGCDQQARCVANGTQPVCQCLEGYFGDGKNCVSGSPSIVRPVDASDDGDQNGDDEQCQDQSNCHAQAHCVLVVESNKYQCQCLPGFDGDGIHNCVHAEECSPSDAQSCTQNARCIYSASSQKFACQCEEGFTRHNAYCLPSRLPQPPPTAAALPENLVCSSCSVDAKCEQMKPSREWICVCNIGYLGNGYVCHREQVQPPSAANCLDNKSICSPHAQCVPNEQHAYVCICNYGYRGNGLVCEAVLSYQQEESSTLLIGRGMSIIQRSSKVDVPGKQLVVVPHQVVVDIAYDCQTQKIFWSDISGHSIRSVALNGTGLNSSFTSQLRSPEGIAIDWPSRNLYYVDSIRNELGVVSLNGRYQKAILAEGLVNPRALVIDINNRHLYYSDWHRESPHIGRIDLDGSNNRIFVSDDIHLPNGLTLLPSRRELCWVDAGSQRLTCIGLNGSGRRVVYAPLEYPFGLTNHQDQRFYWTDWKDHKIHSVSISGDGYTTFLPGAGGKGKIYGLLSLPMKCQEAPTPCSNNNGGCQYLCLPTTQGGSVCKCPDNVTGLEGC